MVIASASQDLDRSRPSILFRFVANPLKGISVPLQPYLYNYVFIKTSTTFAAASSSAVVLLSGEHCAICHGKLFKRTRKIRSLPCGSMADAMSSYISCPGFPHWHPLPSPVFFPPHSCEFPSALCPIFIPECIIYSICLHFSHALTNVLFHV